jgi:hypothetical protein
MDRNIITVEAAAAHNRARIAEVQHMLQRYMREAGGRSTGLVPGTLGGELPIDLQKPDSWYERILKYVPVEALSMYLALDKGAHSALDKGSHSALVLWLAAALACCVAFNVMYLVRIVGLRSGWQVGVSSLALVAYVFINGGVFEAVHVAPPVAQLFVLVVTGAVLIFFKPLPAAGAVQSSAATAGGPG